MSSDVFGSFSRMAKLFGISTQALKQKSNKSDQSTRQRLFKVSQNLISLISSSSSLPRSLSSALPQKNDCRTSLDLPKRYRDNLGLHRPIGHKDLFFCPEKQESQEKRERLLIDTSKLIKESECLFKICFSLRSSPFSKITCISSLFLLVYLLLNSTIHNEYFLKKNIKNNTQPI
jgi:hypothetical protein